MLSVCVTSGEEDYPAAIVWKGSKWYFNTFFPEATIQIHLI